MRAKAARRCTTLLNSRRQAFSTQCQHRQLIADKNPVVNAFVSVSPQSNASKGPLSDLKIAIKDNITTSQLPTTCSSAMLRDFVSPFDATAVKLLQADGADIIGKTNCDEFGMGSLNVHSIHGPVVNPFRLSVESDPSEARSAGGSSGGSAAAVAAGMCDAALGTDTGGSVRLPASYCGVVGLKPSYGIVSRWGVVSYADSLDCVGVLAKDVKTTKRLFDSIARYDDRDPTAAPMDIRTLASRHTASAMSSSVLHGLRVGIPQEYFPAEISTEILDHTRGVIKRLKDAGAVIVPVSLPTTSYALSSYYVLASAEASSNLARYDGVQYGAYVKPDPTTDKTKTSNIYAQTRSVNLGSEVRKRILLGTYALSADAFDNYFLQARRVRQLIKDDFNRVFCIPNYFSDAPESPFPPDSSSSSSPSSSPSSRIDVLLHPSAIRTAPRLAEGRTRSAADLSAYVQDVLTVPASLAGLPALSVPVPVRLAKPGDNAKPGDGEAWPVGISVVGQWGTDEWVLAVGEAMEGLRD